jgi:pSer/pThr/pTyr-binding forkhead associated (FHA) protein
VGSDAAQHFCVSGDDVAPCHARFFSVNGVVYVEPIDAAPVLLNSQPISKRAKVEDGDWLVLGAASFQLLLPRAAESSNEAGAGESLGQQPGAQPAPVVVGRDRQCDLVIDSPLISREHARLLFVSFRQACMNSVRWSGTVGAPRTG